VTRRYLLKRGWVRVATIWVKLRASSVGIFVIVTFVLDCLVVLVKLA
jgi:hypothetical protein